MKKNSENSAFPTEQTIENQSNNGLTKREYFAGLAMQGLIHKLHGQSDNNDLVKIAVSSVIVADELLKQLEEIKP